MYEQIKLAYSFDALEPHIDTLTMETHYGKHHATYTANLNSAAKELPTEFQGMSIESLLQHLPAIPETHRTAIRNNGGGYYNHNLYFELISPNSGGEPEGALAEKINQELGSFENLKAELKTKGLSQFGSGWSWLVIDSEGKLQVINTANQDTPFELGYNKILLAIDVWEHAYYLKYKNLRADYIDAFFNVVDWKKVAERL
jgi:Superoxide dismutase